jgi:hypothetical protein
MVQLEVKEDGDGSTRIFIIQTVKRGEGYKALSADRNAELEV